jgi:hypothetical protein
MNHKKADNFFDNIDYVSIIDTVKGIFTSDGSIAILLDFERVLDDVDLYAYKNWLLGELVQGPVAKRYSVICTFMWPYHLMPDPSGAKRLVNLGCKIKFKKTKIKVPVEVKDYEDFQPGTRFPKTKYRKVWLISIEMPRDIMDNIKEGSIDLAGQTIDLEELDNSFDEDLQDESTQQDTEDQEAAGQSPEEGAPFTPPPAGI